jgi:hypothetical protein
MTTAWEQLRDILTGKQPNVMHLPLNRWCIRDDCGSSRPLRSARPSSAAGKLHFSRINPYVIA